jgi:hypothetical protein
VIQAVETLRGKWDSVIDRGRESLCAVGENFRRRGIVLVGDGKEREHLSRVKDTVVVCVAGNKGSGAAGGLAVGWLVVVGVRSAIGPLRC